MTSGELVRQGLLMLAEGLLIMLVLLSLFRVRAAFGLVPIYVTAAILYQLANLTAGSVLVRVGTDLAVSPGSVVIFPAVLVVVLLVYIREDASEARKLIYGLLAGDFVVAALGVMVAQHLWSPLAINPLSLPPELFLGQPRILIVGTLALYADSLLIILVYEFAPRPFARPLFARLALTLVTVLLVDSALFVTGSFGETPAYPTILLSHALGKTVVGLFYALFLALYLGRVDAEDRLTAPRWFSLGDLFEHLTYRQRYEALRTEMTRDRLTGVFNRAFFDDMCMLLSADSARSGRPHTMLMIDVDHFKQINDTFGHRVGDQVLQGVAAAVRSACRASDLVCRYGGEEFGVLLPDTQLADAIMVARRIGPSVTAALTHADQRWAARPVTLTIGLASYPADGVSFDEVIQIADRRMYQGKEAGRNRVVPATLDELGHVPSPLAGEG